MLDSVTLTVQKYAEKRSVLGIAGCVLMASWNIHRICSPLIIQSVCDPELADFRIIEFREQ